MSPTPQEILDRRFDTVRKDGFDQSQVIAYMGELAQELERRDVELADLRGEVQRLETELAAARQHAAANPSQADSFSKHVAQVLTEAETAAANVVAEAERQASEVRAEADRYAAELRAEADQIRDRAERDVETFRAETVTHAVTMREEAATELDRMHAEAEAAIRRVHEKVSAELAQRAESVRMTEQYLLERIAATAADLDRALGRFDGSAVGDGDDPGSVDLREAETGPDAARRGASGVPWTSNGSSWQDVTSTVS